MPSASMRHDPTQLRQRLRVLRAKLDEAARSGVDPELARRLALDVERTLARLEQRDG
jgi:hypothetical protein